MGTMAASVALGLFLGGCTKPAVKRAVHDAAVQTTGRTDANPDESARVRVTGGGRCSGRTADPGSYTTLTPAADREGEGDGV